jgi:hypothetical protein
LAGAGADFKGEVPALPAPERTSALLERLRTLSALEEAPSQWTGGPAFWLDGREIVHLHEPELVEIRVTRTRMRGALEDERVWQRSRYSDWIVLRRDEVELAVELTWLAIEANRPTRD